MIEGKGVSREKKTNKEDLLHPITALVKLNLFVF